MKKLFIVVVLILVSLVFANGQSFAITGACSGCHTMHNSQNGTVMAAGTVYGNPAYSQLLLGDCLACHTQAGGASPSAPKVDTNIAGSVTAAGSWNQSGGVDTNEHNISVIGLGVFNNPETTGTGTAPGGTFSQANLTCAGANGCHGSGNVAFVAAIPTGQNGLNGYHHNSIAGGAGYRFLRVRGDNNPAVLGTPVGGSGSANWEMTGATAANHNVYQGKVYNAALANSFSDFCNNCHPAFHAAAGDTDQGNPPGTGAFTRHPTDRLIPAAMGAVTVDYVNNPFVWQNTAGISTTAAYVLDNANSQVGCVSCHRSHASAQPDLLRFDYAGQVAGGGNTVGCLGCHVSQR